MKVFNVASGSGTVKHCSHYLPDLLLDDVPHVEIAGARLNMFLESGCCV